MEEVWSRLVWSRAPLYEGLHERTRRQNRGTTPLSSPSPLRDPEVSDRDETRHRIGLPCTGSHSTGFGLGRQRTEQGRDRESGRKVPTERSR